MHRRRKLTEFNNRETDVEKESLIMNMSSNRQDKTPSAPQLIALDPAKSGWLDKKNNSILSHICCCFVKEYKSRFVIVIGNYLFRFSSPESNFPKGVPIPLDSVNISVSSENDHVFELSSVRKSYIFRASSAEERDNWVNIIKSRKLQAIKEGLGHVPLRSNIELVNRAGDALFEERLRKDCDTDSSSNINPLYGVGAPSFQ